ncbi:MAG: prepilin-type N-terminal cleavage/methylation domain-containing protein [bacterium]|nr:prepilin-type N-terminal cleavage/methylation domain-containing protein [bacterium]
MMDRKAFTLIELLIVVAIIGILAAIAVPNFLNAQIKAKVARVRADVKTLSTALQMYQMDNNSYPVDWGGPDVEDRSWRQLTTPIAYISGTEVTRDPFTSDGMGATGSFSNQRTYYDYGGGAWYNDTGGADARNAFWERTVGFLILSFGPNKAREFPWGDSDVIGLARRSDAGMKYVYESSNGLVSPGDIFATRGGPIQ